MRISLKITGAQGQGVNSVGEVCGKGLKRAGYAVFGYREYMSLIKGGHSSYQLDVSAAPLQSSETTVDLLVCFNHHGLERNTREVKPGGVILHQTPQWTFPPADQAWLAEQAIQVLYLPVEDVLKELKFPPILGNMLITSVVWTLIGQSPEQLKELAREQFGHKGEKVIAMNERCIDEGVQYAERHFGQARRALPEAEARFADHLLLTGSEAMGLGLVHAGCRLYVGYPMTPSSPLLSYVSSLQNRTHMVIKQAEDEITAAQMMSGAMHAGTRAATGTSGGGFDLMTETLSLNGLIENPSVFVLAQRPGPATGLPTWTAQGDLLLACFAGHGEYARCVLSVSDAQDCFDLMPTAFNLAEEYQISVIVLTDKQIAEAIYTQPPFDQTTAEIRRGSRLVTDPTQLTTLTAADRYDPAAADGVSQRWLPGSPAGATYVAQGDEHDATGSVDETAENAQAQMEKRMRKLTALQEALPEPELYRGVSGEWSVTEDLSALDLLIVGWGSSKGPIIDALCQLSTDHSSLKAGYLHYTYLWPFKTQTLRHLAARANKIVLVEGNYQGQLGMLIMMQCGLAIPDTILKYDGRPFFVDELREKLLPFVS